MVVVVVEVFCSLGGSGLPFLLYLLRCRIRQEEEIVGGKVRTSSTFRP